MRQAIEAVWAEVDAAGLAPGETMVLADGREVEMVTPEQLRLPSATTPITMRRPQWEMRTMTGTREQCAAWIRTTDVATPDAREKRAQEIATTGPAGVMSWDASILWPLLA